MNPALGFLRRACGWRLAALCGVVLAIWPGRMYPAPDEPAPAGFVWEDLKEIHSRLLRPEKWFFRREVQPPGWIYCFAPQPFEGPGEVKKGLTISEMTKVKNLTEKSADEYAAAVLAELGTKGKVLKGWTRKGEPPGPFTTYALVCLSTEEGDSVTYMVEILCVANRETDTLYAFILSSPRAEWKDVEQWGETMLANLRLDAKF